MVGVPNGEFKQGHAEPNLSNRRSGVRRMNAEKRRDNARDFNRIPPGPHEINPHGKSFMSLPSIVLWPKESGSFESPENLSIRDFPRKEAGRGAACVRCYDRVPRNLNVRQKTFRSEIFCYTKKGYPKPNAAARSSISGGQRTSRSNWSQHERKGEL
jgi:hypothetical protein